MTRRSYRVRFAGGAGFDLTGIVDRPDVNPARDHPASPVVVFSHCFTCNKDLKAIVRISRALSDMGIAVLRFDMTGLGASEGEFSKTSFSSNVADLRSAIRFAKDEFGPMAKHVLNSWGVRRTQDFGEIVFELVEHGVLRK